MDWLKPELLRLFITSSFTSSSANCNWIDKLFSIFNRWNASSVNPELFQLNSVEQTNSCFSSSSPLWPWKYPSVLFLTFLFLLRTCYPFNSVDKRFNFLLFQEQLWNWLPLCTLGSTSLLFSSSSTNLRIGICIHWLIYSAITVSGCD